jgi:aminoglycoside phosphotransferase (APT) family kinase protein
MMIAEPVTETDVAELLKYGLTAIMPKFVADVSEISLPVRLSGGASQETWAFEAISRQGTVPLILRRAPGGTFERDVAAGLATEALVVRTVGEANVPVAPVRHILTDEEGLGRGFISDRIEGETIPRKLLRDDEYADVRSRLAPEIGAILAHIHSVPRAVLPRLATRGADETLAYLRQELDTSNPPSPILELAYRWLCDHKPGAIAPRLVHGDFRNGNLIIGPDRVRAVLDWELVHLGDPMEDLGWFCAMPWRFGAIHAPAGGFGSREALYRAYACTSDGPIDLERVRWWETLASLRWGVNCRSYVALFESGQDRSVERAMIARRASENEIDLLRLMEFGA